MFDEELEWIIDNNQSTGSDIYGALFAGYTHFLPVLLTLIVSHIACSSHAFVKKKKGKTQTYSKNFNKIQLKYIRSYVEFKYL